MNRASFYVFVILVFVLPVEAFKAGSDSQAIGLERSLQIPGGSLPPGHYTLSVEDRLRGRAIVRIQNTQTREHQLLLAVPNSEMKPTAGNSIVFFDSANGNKLILRAWSCPDCNSPLEMVYPKAEAVQMTAETGQSVMAADPSFDRLPSNLSQDDMKVVTLWLLAPERISNHRGEGLKAVKYSAPLTNTMAAPTRRQLPQTASNNYSLETLGLLFFTAYLALRIQRRGQMRCRGLLGR